MPRDYDSVQINLSPEDAAKILAIPLDPTDFAEKGRDMEPHVTVLFGLSDLTADEVGTFTKGSLPIEVKLGELEAFQGNDEYEPLVIRINNPLLNALHNRLATLPHYNTHPDYKAHICLAYIKPGHAAKYVDAGYLLQGTNIVLNNIVFSLHDGDQQPLLRCLRYSPDQPRDDHGRFGEGATDFAKADDARKLEITIHAWQDEDTSTRTIHEAQIAAKASDAKNPIVQGIRSEKFDTVIFRGLTVEKTDEIAKWEVGQTVQILPSSFSRSEHVAELYADGNSDKPIKVLLRINGGGNGIVVGDRSLTEYEQEKEVITGGHFKVTGMGRNSEDIFIIKLKQTGVF